MSGPVVKRWREHRNTAGTMLAFFAVELSSGIVINGFRLMVGPRGKRWVAPPSQKRTDRDGNPQLVDGRPVWDDVVEFRDARTRDRFNTVILEILSREHPEAFA